MAAELALHVESHGDGPALMLGHGFGGSARNFRPQARGLGSRYRVVLFDARGHARSEVSPEAADYTPDAFVADVGRVLDAVGADRAFVGGLSMGAAVALLFALARPERVRGLVLASFPASGAARRELAFAEALEREGLEAAGARFVWGEASGLDPGGAALVRQGFLEHSPRALAHTLRGLLARLPSVEALAPRLASLDRPVLLVTGALDAASTEASRALAAALPRARRVEIADGGHVVNLERPKAFNEAVAEFLDSSL